MADHQLTLQEQVLLLCLDDQSGRIESRWLDEGLSAAALGDLLLRGRLRLDANGLVAVADRTPVGDEALDAALERVAESAASLSVGRWIDLLRDSALLNGILIPRLIRRGILRKEGQRFLFIFNQTVYPTLSSLPEEALRQQLRAAITGSEPVDEALAALTAILARMQETPEEPVGALRFLLAEAEQSAYRPRVEAIIAASPIALALARGVGDAIRAARASG